MCLRQIFVVLFVVFGSYVNSAAGQNEEKVSIETLAPDIRTTMHQETTTICKTYRRNDIVIQSTTLVKNAEGQEQQTVFFDKDGKAILTWLVDPNEILTIQPAPNAKADFAFLDCDNDGAMDIFEIDFDGIKENREVFIMQDSSNIEPISSDLLKECRQNDSYWLLDKISESKKATKDKQNK